MLSKKGVINIVSLLLVILMVIAQFFPLSRKNLVKNAPYRRSKRGVINIVSLLLVILMVFAVAGGLYFWFAKIQSSSQQTATQYADETLTNVITEIKIVDEPVYNTLAEDVACLPASLTMLIQNTGAKKLDISNNSEIIVSTGEGPICLSTFTGGCLSSEDRLYAAKQNGAAVNANISYSTDGTTWVSADDSIGTLELLSSKEFNEKLYFGGHYTAPDALKGAQVFKSCDFASWSVDTSIPEAERIYALEVFGGELYAGSSSLTGTGNGHIYKLETNTSWSLVNTSGQDRVSALEVFGSYLYAGIAYDENLSRTSDGAEWITVDAGLGNITALSTYDSYLYAGLDDGKIWRSSDGSNFGGAEVVDTGDEGVLAFEEFNGNLYAGTNKSGDASIWEFDGGSWTERYDSSDEGTNNDSVNDFAVMNGYIYAALSGNSGGAILRSADGTTWTEAYSEDSTVNYTSIVNYTYCNNEKVSCLRGCGSEIVPGETRALELQLSNTDCDISGYGTTTDYSFRINFGSAAAVSGRFGKKVLETTNSNTVCEKTYPLCNGACTAGTCTTTPLAQACICFPSMPCEAIDPFMFDCSLGTGCGAQTCTLQAGEGRCACA